MFRKQSKVSTNNQMGRSNTNNLLKRLITYRLLADFGRSYLVTTVVNLFYVPNLPTSQNSCANIKGNYKLVSKYLVTSARVYCTPSIKIQKAISGVKG